MLFQLCQNHRSPLRRNTFQNILNNQRVAILALADEFICSMDVKLFFREIDDTGKAGTHQKLDPLRFRMLLRSILVPYRLLRNEYPAAYPVLFESRLAIAKEAD